MQVRRLALQCNANTAVNVMVMLMLIYASCLSVCIVTASALAAALTLATQNPSLPSTAAIERLRALPLRTFDSYFNSKKNDILASLLLSSGCDKRAQLPQSLLTEQIEVRRALLEGVQSVCERADSKRDGEFTVAAKEERFVDEVRMLARGLGHYSRKGTTKTDAQQLLHTLTVSSAPASAPLSHRFLLTRIGDGCYHGFTLDGNGRCLLADGTVTHNTSLMVKYVEGNFNEDYIQTLGVNFMEVSVVFDCAVQ